MRDLFRGLSFRIAEGSERTAALGLRRDVYAQDWSHIPVAQVVDDADQKAHQLIAVNQIGDIVATLRIVPDDQRPFDMERFISLHEVLPEGRSPAEIGRLCVRHDLRQVRSDSFVHLGLLKLAVDIARDLGITDFYLTALPPLRKFYALGRFVEVGITFEHSSWGLVHIMRLDLIALWKRQGGADSSIERFLQNTRLPNFRTS